jgi:hypothetical protein
MHNINSHIGLEPGLYVNIFQVIVPDVPMRFMLASRTRFPDLRPLRKRILDEERNIQVYAPSNSDKVYGYGSEANYLQNEGFEEELLSLVNFPQLTTYLLGDGLLNALKAEGYEARFGKGRLMVFHPDRFKTAANNNIKVYQGYDLKATFWKEPISGNLTFGLVIDITWSIRDKDDKPLSMQRIAQFNAVTQIAQIQGEYLPGGTRINTEIARQRFQEQILPFVYGHSEFELPCGGIARLSSHPIRIILGENET